MLSNGVEHIAFATITGLLKPHGALCPTLVNIQSNATKTKIDIYAIVCLTIVNYA